MKCSAIISLFLIFFSFNAFGQESTTQENTEKNTAQDTQEQDESVETIAPRLSKVFFKTRASESLNSKQVDESSSLGEALDKTSGVMLQETSRGGGTVFMRGLIGPENLILIDGIRFNQSTFRTGPNQYLDTIGLSAIDSIETVNGPAGLLFGSNAIGGVINLKTTDTLAKEHQANGYFGFNSARNVTHGNLRVDIAAAPNTTLRFGINYGREGAFNAGEGEFLMAALNKEGRFLGNAFEDFGWSLGLDSKPSNDVKFTFRYLDSSISNSPRLDRLGKGEVRLADNDDRFGYFRTDFRASKYFDNASVVLMFHRTNEAQHRFKCKKIGKLTENLEECAQRQENEITSTRLNFDTVTTLGLSSTISSKITNQISIDWGIDLYRDDVVSKREQTKNGKTKIRRGNFPEGAAYSTAGIFAQPTWIAYESEDSSLELQGGLRGDWVNANAKKVPGLGDVDYTHLAPVGSLSLSYITASLVTWINWNQGFRPPNLQETTLLGDTGNFFEIPNDELKPERSNSFELGARFQNATIGNIGGSLFVNIVDNKITRLPATFENKNERDDKEVRKRINEGDAYYYGVEANFKSKTFYHIALGGNFSLIEGALSSKKEDTSFESPLLHDLLKRNTPYQSIRRLPPIQYRFIVDYKLADFSTEFWIEGASAQRNISKDDRKDLRICELSPGKLNPDCQGTDGWITTNIKARYQFNELGLYLGVENIFDLLYRRHGSGVPGAGRSIVGGLRLSL